MMRKRIIHKKSKRRPRFPRMRIKTPRIARKQPPSNLPKKEMNVSIAEARRRWREENTFSPKMRALRTIVLIGKLTSTQRTVYAALRHAIVSLKQQLKQGPIQAVGWYDLIDRVSNSGLPLEIQNHLLNKLADSDEASR